MHMLGFGWRSECVVEKENSGAARRVKNIEVYGSGGCYLKKLMERLCERCVWVMRTKK